MKKYVMAIVACLMVGCVPLAGIDGKPVAIIQTVPVPVDSDQIADRPIVIINDTQAAKDKQKIQDNQAVYVCTIKPFTRTFRSENTNRGRAMLDAQKQCAAQHNGDFFCKKEDIQCTEYK